MLKLESRFIFIWEWKYKRVRITIKFNLLPVTQANEERRRLHS